MFVQAIEDSTLLNDKERLFNKEPLESYSLENKIYLGNDFVLFHKIAEKEVTEFEDKVGCYRWLDGDKEVNNFGKKGDNWVLLIDLWLICFLRS